MAETDTISGPLEPDLDHTSGGKWKTTIHSKRMEQTITVAS